MTETTRATTEGVVRVVGRPNGPTLSETNLAISGYLASNGGLDVSPYYADLAADSGAWAPDYCLIEVPTNTCSIRGRYVPKPCWTNVGTLDLPALSLHPGFDSRL